MADPPAVRMNSSGWGWAVAFLIIFLPPLILQYMGTSFQAQDGVKTGHMREVADLLDHIYITLSKMSFIPETAIKRGPHSINRTHAVASGRSEAAMALMETIPYVEKFSLDNQGWLFGGDFADYRDQHDLQDLSDPLHNGGDYMNPDIVPLTIWGHIQSVLLYDVKRDIMRLIHSDLYFVHDLDFQPLGDPKDRLRLHGPGAQDVFNALPSYPAPKMLKDILKRLKSADLLPWGRISESEEKAVIKQLLEKNGWPHDFDGDQFNVDLIRHRSKSPGKGWAEGPLRYIGLVEGERGGDCGWLETSRQKIERFRRKLFSTVDPEERLRLQWKLKKEAHNIEQLEDRLAEAKAEVQRLCPGGVCVRTSDLILWELRNIERELEWAERVAKEEFSTYQSDLDNVALSSEDLKRRYEKMNWKQQKLDWLVLAHSQCEAEVLKYCKDTGADRLPPDNERSRAIEENEQARKHILRIEAYVEKLRRWKTDLVGTSKAELSEEVIEEIIDGDIWGQEMEVLRLKAIIAKNEKWYASQGQPLPETEVE